jgi:integrase
MTLRQLIADYLHYRSALGYRLARDTQILGAFGRRFGYLPLRAISAHRVHRFLCPDHICHDTVARRHRALRGFYRYVEARHGALLPPLADLPNGSSSNFKPYIYSHAELKRLLQATSLVCSSPLCQVHALTLHTLILLLYGAGLRLGEALALNSADLDLGSLSCACGRASSTSHAWFPSAKTSPECSGNIVAALIDSIQPIRTVPSSVFATAVGLTTRSWSEPSVACV